MNQATPVTLETFQAAVLEASKSTPVLVDFWAAWCAPCRMLMPVLDKLAEAYGGAFTLVKVDTDAQQQLAAEQGIRSLPTVRLYVDGRASGEFMGALPEASVREFLEQHLPPREDPLHAAAIEAMAGGDPGRAEQLLGEALAQSPGNTRAVSELLDLLLARKAYSEAKALRDSLDESTRSDESLRPQLLRLGFAEHAASTDDLETVAERARAGDDEARYRLAALRALEGEYGEAAELLLAIIAHDRGFRDDAARRAILALFELLGDDPAAVSRYRARLASLLH